MVGTRWSAEANANHAFLYTPGVGIIDLGTFGEHSHTAATSVNDAGQIVGWTPPEFGDPPQRAFLYTAEAGLQDFGTLGGRSASASSINNQGWIIGDAVDGAGMPRPFLYRPEVGKIDLNRLTNPFGGTLLGARAINNNGDIIGESLVNGQHRGFLLTLNSATEVPEPATFAILSGALAALLWMKIRR